MTFWDWVASDQGSRFLVTLVGAIAALGAYLRSRTNGKKVDTVHTLVNGAATTREERLSQLENFIVSHGLAIPPSPQRHTVEPDPQIPIPFGADEPPSLIPPPRQGT